MRIGFFLGAFPNTSETFVLNQISGVVAAGHAVDIHAWQGVGQVQHPLLKQHDLLEHVCHRPVVPDGKAGRIFKVSVLAMMLLVLDMRRTWRLFSMYSDMPLGEWIELFFVAFPLRGGRKYDVIHAHFGPNGQMAVRLRQAGFLTGSIVTSFHGYDANVVPNALGAGYYRTLFRQGEAFIVSSLFIRNRLLQLGLAAQKIHHIAVGIDVAKWGFHIRKVGGRPVIISVGRLVEVKGFSYAIAAMSLVKEQFPDVLYRLVGEGPLRVQLEQQVAALGLQHRVLFCGIKSEVELIKAFRDADLFVMPSVHIENGAEEGQGMVLLEAQAAGLPVVATRSGGIPESVPEGKYLVAEKDVNALAQAMVECLQSCQQQGYDGSEGYNFVRRYFDIDALNRKLLDLYSGLL